MRCCVLWSSTGILVDGGSRGVPTVQSELAKVLPPGIPPLQANYAPGIEAKAERAIRPESIALGVFGVICGLAAVLIALQIVGRRLRSDVPELGTLRALGADRRMIMGAELIGPIGAIMLGSLLAALVAVGLSPLAPLGVVRQVDPTPGVDFDWTVLGFGVVVLIIVLARRPSVIAYRITTRLKGHCGEDDRRSDQRWYAWPSRWACLSQPSWASASPLSREQVAIRFRSGRPLSGQRSPSSWWSGRSPLGPA